MNPKYAFLALLGFTVQSTCAQSPTGSRNYILETTIKSPGHKTIASLSGLPVDSANRTVKYFDGLGRPLQTVSWQGSPTKKDLVQVTEYDALGREAKKYLPYAAQAGADGAFKPLAASSQQAYYGSGSWDASVKQTPFPFSLTVFEASPLNRVLEQGAPGAGWQPVPNSTAGHTAKTEYGSNSATEVLLWKITASGASAAGSYPAGRLYRTVSMDENWKTADGRAGTTEEFKDFEGRVVLKRVWENGTVGLDTYYVYDVFGSLRYVVPPAVAAASFSETDAVFEQFIYGYHYDARKRLTEKKVPGKGWEHMVYNELDQVVLTQDSSQRALGKWMFSKYDALGRTVVTGSVNSTRLRAGWQADMDVQPVLWEQRDDTDASHTGTGYTSNALPNVGIGSCYTISYYDDYSFFGNTFGLPNGTTEVNGNRTKGLATASKVNILGTSDFLLTVNYYDAEGRAVRMKSGNHLNGTDEVQNSYSFAGELKESRRTHSSVIASVAQGVVVENRYGYDHMGRKIFTEENIANKGWVRLSKLEYNEIGQLKKKSLHSIDGGTTFLQHTDFAYNERGWLKNSTSAEFKMQLDYEDGTVPQYNGNISSQRWGSTLNNVFTYSYDRLNRLTSGTSTGIVMNEALSYDVMGNITSMSRSDGTAAKTGTYNYTGNRLNNISGGLLATGNYAYDANGNAVTDGRNGISLTYNVLNLPETAVRTSGTPVNIAYAYSAGGQKLKKTSGTAVTDYANGIQYENGTIDLIQTEEGIAKRSGTDYVYQYNLTDHLGNVRVTFNKNPGTGLVQKLQEDDYYAFGLRRVASAGTNKYLYNGKELQEEMEAYDYGARFYDPVIGRFNTIDPLAEMSRRNSPYSYALNNPICFVDVDGMYAGEAGRYRRGDREFDDVLAYYGFTSINKDEEQNQEQPKPKKKETPEQKRDREIAQNEAALNSLNKNLQGLNMLMFKIVEFINFARLTEVASEAFFPAKLPIPKTIVKSPIQFGNPEVANQVYHAERYLKAAGISIEETKAAIITDLKPASSYKVGVRIEGTVEVGGRKIIYSGVKLPDGTINIGSIKPPR